MSDGSSTSTRWKHQCEVVARIWPRDGSAVALTGAGISVPSGIPDFRSPGGLWSRFDPQRVASTWGLDNDPTGVWEFLLEAARMLDAAAPNPAHYALAELEKAGRLAGIVTQNIDGLHQRAGSANVVEFHGGCGRYYCNACGLEHAAAVAPTLTPDQTPWLCAACGGVVRPEVVFFGEMIPPDALRASLELVDNASLALIVGTSGEVAPANALPRAVARNGGQVVEINLGPTAFADISDIRIDAPAEIVLPYLAGLILA